METKALKKQMGAAIAMVLVAAIALGSATFAWFVNNTKVKAESVDVTAKSANTLLISHGADGNWGTTAAFGSTESKNFVPVSTVDATNFFKDNAWTTETDGQQKGQYNASGFTTAVAGTDYYTDTFKVKASQACGLYLDNETTLTVNTPTGDNAVTKDAEADVLKSMRLALVVGDKKYFYQVNANAIAGAGNSYNTTLTSLNADGITNAINGASAASAIDADNLTDNKVIALSAGLATAPTDNTTLIEKNDNIKLCDLAANQEQEIKVYIWMEGCDYDCNSTVVKDITEKAVTCVLGFCAGKTA